MATTINIPSISENPQNVLYDAFKRNDLEKFKFALETLNAKPNYITDEQDGTSIFKEILRTPERAKFIELCIEHGADLYATDNDSLPPLISAIDSYSPDNLKAFLRTFKQSEINYKYNGKNCLHLLINELPKGNYEVVKEMIKILIKHGADVNSINNTNRTAFHELLKVQKKLKNQHELVDFIVENCAVDAYNYRGDELRRLFIEQNPHLDVPKKIESIVNEDSLMSCLLKKDNESFMKNFKNFHAKTDEVCSRFLFDSIKNGNAEIVEFLAENNVNIDRKLNSPECILTPISLACSYGNHEILKILLNHKAKIDDNLLQTILHASYQNENHYECFKLLLTKCDVNFQDEYNCTPLHYAVRHHNSEAIIDLLKSGSYIGIRNVFNEIPLDDMKSEVFEEYLDDCIWQIRTPGDSEQKEVKIGINYSFLVSPKNSYEFKAEMPPLEAMAENSELRPLIQHPVISSFIFLKWTRMSLLFYGNFAMFSLLMLAFINYIVLCHLNSDSSWIYVFKMLSFLGILLLTLREIFQLILCYMSSITYFKSPINIFEIIFIILAFCSQIFEGTLSDLQLRAIRASTILCAAFEFLHLVGELPFLHISTHMVILQKVAATFLKSLLLYSIVLISFALSFFILFSGRKENADDEFNNFEYPGIAIIKTFVMLTGEFDASSLSLQDKGAYYCILFLIFVFTVTIVLFNLLSALAVDDTQKIKAEGELIDLCERIKVLGRYERMILGKSNCFPLWENVKRMITVFHHVLPEAKVQVQPNKGFAMSAVKSSESSTTFYTDDEDYIGCIKSKMKTSKETDCCLMCQRLDYKIGKKLRAIIEERKGKREIERKEKSVMEEMRVMREELRELREICLKK